MKYLSIDLEATGLEKDDYIIEFAAIPFDTEKGLAENLTFEKRIYCPSFEELRPKLNQWVIDHNKELIELSHSEGITLEVFKKELTAYLESKEVVDYFDNEQIILFGKSMNAIDLPFLNRDLGWDYMRKYFVHRIQDLSCVAYNLIDMKKIPAECSSGGKLMSYLGMGEVAHTALDDAKNTAIMYLKLIEKCQ